MNAKKMFKKINPKLVWTFECLKIDLIFKSPYYNNLLMDFNVFLFL